jgi:hypothetical protein
LQEKQALKSRSLLTKKKASRATKKGIQEATKNNEEGVGDAILKE